VRGITEARSVTGDLAVNTSTSEQFNACCKNKEERLTRRKFFRGSTLVPMNEGCRTEIPLRRDMFYPLKSPIILIFICTLHVLFIIYIHSSQHPQ
jgi:hypothetical protein